MEVAHTSYTTPWVILSETNLNTRMRLFCFPYAGGGASLFRNWHRHLPSDVAVCAVQLPGRENRLSETPYTGMDMLVTDLVDALRPILNRPFAFFGYSMGALISFEVARYLREYHELAPEMLFVAAHRGPQLLHPDPVTHNLSDETFIDKLRRMKGTPRDVLNNTELMALRLPTLRADFTLCGTYTYLDAPPLDCPISAFAGTRDTIAPKAVVDTWREQTCNTFSLRLIAGNHFFIHSALPTMLWAVEHDLQE
ncbi:MAG: thioesterase [Chloroflexi bacterium AL-W]|nr:thioesterase [Chloroflexi bacterium AL-N1]NOK64600.1 thioesterase [Chloroflexi bacterium AL-N10]NOK75842.1 thioesterase [Chloroflexi bacterium AL-N5]NOK80399.1 thioesterase [Chloroflexi bacterium AL-W]NOK86913.1 thioesterase [Chloroflexi bacterium AL-N15]